MFFNPDKAYQEYMARAQANGLTWEQQADVDEYMAHVYEAMIHAGNLGFIALSAINPILLPVAWKAGLLSAWLASTHDALEKLGDAVAESQNDTQYFTRAATYFVGCSVVCGGVLALFAWMTTAILAIAF